MTCAKDSLLEQQSAIPSFTATAICPPMIDQCEDNNIEQELPPTDPLSDLHCDCHQNESYASLAAALSATRQPSSLASRKQSLSLERKVQICLEQCKHRNSAYLSKAVSAALTETHADIIEISSRTRFRICPIHSCPPETMHEIFSNLTPYSTISLKPKKKVSSSIFYLTWICHHWRKLIFNRGHYWARVEIDLSLVPEDAEFADFLVGCISRSRNAPMDVSLWDAKHVDESIQLTKAQRHVFESLLLASSRWEEVTLELGAGIIDHCSTASFQQRFQTPPSTPLLKFLALQSRAHSNSEPLPPPLLRYFVGCPLLGILHTEFWHPLLPDRVDLTHLTQLAIGHYIGNGLAKLLSGCPVLEYLMVSGFYYSDEFGTLAGEIYHPLLATLHIGFAGEGFDARAVQGIYLPGLQTLTLQSDFPIDGYLDSYLHPNPHTHDHLTQTLQAMLRRSKCNLRTLRLIWLQADAALELISECPSISHLAYTGLEISAALLTKLTLTEVTFIAPNLTSLVLSDGALAESLDCETFENLCCKMVGSRVNSTREKTSADRSSSSPQGLNTFLVHFLRPSTPNLRASTERIQSRLQKLGLEVVEVGINLLAKW